MQRSIQLGHDQCLNPLGNLIHQYSMNEFEVCLELICSRRLQQAELNSKTVFLILSLMADRCCHRSPSSCSPTPKSFYFAQGHVQQIEFPLNEISLFYLWYPFSALCKQTCFFLKIQNPRQNPLSTGCTKSNSIKIRESLFTSLLKKAELPSI